MAEEKKSLIVKIEAENNMLHLLIADKEDIDILKSFFDNVIQKAEKTIPHPTTPHIS